MMEGKVKISIILNGDGFNFDYQGIKSVKDLIKKLEEIIKFLK